VKSILGIQYEKRFVLIWLTLLAIYFYASASAQLAFIQYLAQLPLRYAMPRYLEVIRWYEFGTFAGTFLVALVLSFLFAWILKSKRGNLSIVSVVFIVWVVGYGFAAESGSLRSLLFLQGLNLVALIGGICGTTLRLKTLTQTDSQSSRR
jgi:hypothetical protein